MSIRDLLYETWQALTANKGRREMSIRDLLYETWQALTANKGRSALTILGIVIGIAAVIAMTSLIGGVKQSLVSELGLDQSRVVHINYMADSEPTTTVENLRELEESVPGYEFVTGSQSGMAKATTDTKSSDVSVYGVAPKYFTTLGASVVEGRVFTDQESQSYDMMAVIDTTLSRSLFGEDVNHVGKEIKLNDVAYMVVGEIELEGMFTQQGCAYIPLGTCAQRITGMDSIDQVVGFAEEDADIELVAQHTESYLRNRYHIIKQGEDEEVGGYVYVFTMQSIQQELDTMMMSFQMLMTAVASISLLVGGIGIMNMMLTNVSERIREIGLRKALGARRSDITMQFLVESVALCMAGGVIGFLVGMAAAHALSGVASMFADGIAVTPYFDLATILMVVGICTVIGVIFGYGPARRAAKLDPVESLRFQ